MINKNQINNSQIEASLYISSFKFLRLNLIYCTWFHSTSSLLGFNIFLPSGLSISSVSSKVLSNVFSSWRLGTKMFSFIFLEFLRSSAFGLQFHVLLSFFVSRSSYIDKMEMKRVEIMRVLSTEYRKETWVEGIDGLQSTTICLIPCVAIHRQMSLPLPYTPSRSNFETIVYKIKRLCFSFWRLNIF